MPIQEAMGSLGTQDLGLYRIRGRDQGDGGLVYIGEGVVWGRLRAHLQKVTQPGHRQGAVLAGAEALEVSWVVDPGWLKHQRLELETDLIGAYVLRVGGAPSAQFLG